MLKLVKSFVHICKYIEKLLNNTTKSDYKSELNLKKPDCHQVWTPKTTTTTTKS